MRPPLDAFESAVARLSTAANALLTAGIVLATTRRNAYMTPLHVLAAALRTLAIERGLVRIGVEPQRCRADMDAALQPLFAGATEPPLVNTRLLDALEILLREAETTKICARRLVEAVAREVPSHRALADTLVRAAVAAADDLEPKLDSDDFRRYSAGSKDVLMRAQTLADKRGHAEVVPAHLLIELYSLFRSQMDAESPGAFERLMRDSEQILHALPRRETATFSHDLMLVLSRAEALTPPTEEVGLLKLTAAIDSLFAAPPQSPYRRPAGDGTARHS